MSRKTSQTTLYKLCHVRQVSAMYDRLIRQLPGTMCKAGQDEEGEKAEQTGNGVSARDGRGRQGRRLSSVAVEAQPFSMALIALRVHCYKWLHKTGSLCCLLRAWCGEFAVTSFKSWASGCESDVLSWKFEPAVGSLKLWPWRCESEVVSLKL